MLSGNGWSFVLPQVVLGSNWSIPLKLVVSPDGLFRRKVNSTSNTSDFLSGSWSNCFHSDKIQLSSHFSRTQDSINPKFGNVYVVFLASLCGNTLFDKPVCGLIDEAADRLVEQGVATKTGKKYNIDVSKLGIDRILGSGKVTRKLNLVGVKAITPRAREKVTGVGGTIDLPAE